MPIAHPGDEEARHSNQSCLLLIVRHATPVSRACQLRWNYYVGTTLGTFDKLPLANFFIPSYTATTACRMFALSRFQHVARSKVP
jgi:hypothetical protein